MQSLLPSRSTLAIKPPRLGFGQWSRLLVTRFQPATTQVRLISRSQIQSRLLTLSLAGRSPEASKKNNAAGIAFSRDSAIATVVAGLNSKHTQGDWFHD